MKKRGGGTNELFNDPIGVIILIVIILLFIIFLYYVYIWWYKQVNHTDISGNNYTIK